MCLLQQCLGHLCEQNLWQPAGQTIFDRAVKEVDEGGLSSIWQHDAGQWPWQIGLQLAGHGKVTVYDAVSRATPDWEFEQHSSGQVL